MKVKDLKKLLSQMDDNLDVKVKYGANPNNFRDPNVCIVHVEEKVVKVEGNAYSFCSTGKYNPLLSL
jgi:hypothetical protein